jgi:UDP-3-O-[3-hydroxymyristoyl] N-acetylglucosamine deacetylase
MLNQRTLRNAIKAKGIGLHTGKVVNMELIPSGPILEFILLDLM